MELKAQGRRLGPNGSFAILRAKSAAYLDIAIRVHAEFDITPITWSAEMPEPDQVWYTPSYFTGRIIVNRETGSVDYFHLALPEDTTLNVHVTVSLNHRTMDSHDIVRVDRMELIGGDAEFATKELLWDEAISRSERTADWNEYITSLWQSTGFLSPMSSPSREKRADQYWRWCYGEIWTIKVADRVALT